MTDPTPHASDPSPRLVIEGLRVSLPGASKKAPRKQVLDGVDLTLSPGRISGIAGESGSGKTMTGLAVLGLLPTGARTEGDVRFEGRNLLSLGSRELNTIRGRKIAMVFQDPSTSLHPMLKVGVQLTDHMRKHLGLSRSAAMAKAEELLDRVAISSPREALAKYPHQFSGGMRQRIAIAIALACDPQVIIADEPTTALDVTVQAGVLRLLRGLCDDLEVAIMLVTHDLGVMSAIADDVTVMRHGVVVEHGPRFDVLTRPQHPYTRELIASLPGNRIADPLEHGHADEVPEDLESAPWNALLEVDDLVVTYKSFGKEPFTAVRGVSLRVGAGEVVGLVGESGCGKSTIARTVCGLEPATEGMVRFEGREVRHLGMRTRAREQWRLQMVFQDPFNSLNPRRTIGSQIADGVALGKSLGGRSGLSAKDWLERVELSRDDASSFAHRFSGGQRQRIAIARALAAEPSLLIADEPISALDASLQAQIADLMSRLVRDSGAGMLFISHDLAVVRLIADRILVMKDGEIVEEGPTEQVWNDPQHVYTKTLLASIPLPDGLGRLPGLAPAT